MTQEYEYYIYALNKYKTEKDPEKKAYYKGIIDSFKNAHLKELHRIPCKYNCKAERHYS